MAVAITSVMKRPRTSIAACLVALVPAQETAEPRPFFLASTARVDAPVASTFDYYTR